MEKEKKKNQDFVVKSVAFVVAVLAFIGGYIMSNEINERVFKANSNNSNKEIIDDNVEIASKTLSNKTLGFNGIVENSSKKYNLNLGMYAGSKDSYFTLSYGDKKSEINIVKYSYDNSSTQEYTMSFVENVVDVYEATFGSDPSLNSILFLLESGNVEYAFIDEIADLKSVAIHKNINLSNIVKFYDSSVCDETDVCEDTTLAQDINGKVYDLSNYIIK